MTGPTGEAHVAALPEGWYPDPSGAPAWRRWEGTAWGDATMPYGPTNPDPGSLALEAAAWRPCRAIAPWAIAAQALGAAELASESGSYAAVRRWFHVAWRATLNHTTVPPLPTNPPGSTSSFATVVHLAVLFATVLGVVAWLRFSVAAMRVAVQARYPQRHRPLATSILFFVPVAGPLVAWGASAASLPTGHEARDVLRRGWLLVLAGQICGAATYAAVFTTSSVAAVWVVAGLAALAWVMAAIELPAGLAAIADDHASLSVRRAPAYS